MFCLKSLKVKGRKKNKNLLASVSLEKLESKRKKKETKISLPLFHCPLAPAAPDCRGQHWQFLQGPFDILFSNIVRNNFGLHSKIIVVDIISIRTSILAYHNPQIYLHIIARQIYLHIIARLQTILSCLHALQPR